MLTKNDLFQIKTIVGEVVDQKLEPVNQKLDGHDREFKSINQKLDGHNREFKKNSKKINKIQRDIKTIINYFDHNSIDHEHRLEQIEHCLNLKSPV